jgi:hypothetical protein
MMLRVKIHKAYRTIVAVSDPELIGKKFIEDNLQLDLNKEFYGDNSNKIDEEKGIRMMKAEREDDATFNIVGENAVKAAIKAGVINDEEGSIIMIQGVPHALSLL